MGNNWLADLQLAIDYIEEHILEMDKTSASDIADRIFVSEHNFRKVFSVITGVTIGEYIRNRRLSLAGEELLMSDAPILNIALKYGYDTPESFTKAFSRFHGVSPSYVKKNRGGVKTYTRMVLRVDASGGTKLDYSMEELGDMYIVGYQKAFDAQEIEENNKSIPKFVQESLKKDYEGLCTLCTKEPFADSIVGYRCDIDEQMYYTVGVIADDKNVADAYIADKQNMAMEGCSVVAIKAGKWLCFRCELSTTKAMQQLWYQIYTELMPFADCRMEDNITLEVSYCRDGKNERYLYMPLEQDNN